MNKIELIRLILEEYDIRDQYIQDSDSHDIRISNLIIENVYSESLTKIQTELIQFIFSEKILNEIESFKYRINTSEPYSIKVDSLDYNITDNDSFIQYLIQEYNIQYEHES